MSTCTCLCHVPDGSEGVHYIEHQQALLRGAEVTIVGLEGTWAIVEMNAPDEAEVIDAEIWVKSSAPD